jgi:Lipocalin-like domain
MNRRSAAMVLLFAIFFAAAPVSPSPDGPPKAKSQSPAERLIGAWRLVSVEGNSPVRSVQFDHPTGLIMYDRSGWMSVQIALHQERKPFAKGAAAGTLEERAEAYDTYLCYYGIYTVDVNAGTVTHHMTDHTYPGLRGHDNVRWFEFQGENRVVLIPTEDGKGGQIERKNATYKLTWERVQ